MRPICLPVSAHQAQLALGVLCQRSAMPCRAARWPSCPAGGCCPSSFGLLVFGAPDPSRFSPDQGIDFLERLAELRECCLAVLGLPAARRGLRWPLAQRTTSSSWSCSTTLPRQSMPTDGPCGPDRCPRGLALGGLHHATASASAGQDGPGWLAPRSLRRRLAAWRGYFAWLVSQRVLTQNPVAALKAPKAERLLPKALSVDAACAYVSGVPATEDSPFSKWQAARARALLELTYASGLRLSELVA